ncbi:MAG: GIY-YIG nuclease family protein [Nitrospira sp.]|nr:GIY-YIG nuclease family protein [Nitrospira sp.]
MECFNTALYAGITADLESRLARHLKRKRAEYSKHRGPFSIVVLTELQETKAQELICTDDGLGKPM